MLARGVWVAVRDLRFAYSRSRGPGGQSVNKVNSRAELRVAVEAIQGLDERAAQRLRRLAGKRLTSEDELQFDADGSRSQLRNRRSCVNRLAELVAEALSPPPPRKPTRPTRGSRQRRLEAKRRQSEKKQRRGWSEQ